MVKLKLQPFCASRADWYRERVIAVAFNPADPDWCGLSIYTLDGVRLLLARKEVSR